MDFFWTFSGTGIQLSQRLASRWTTKRVLFDGGTRWSPGLSHFCGRAHSSPPLAIVLASASPTSAVAWLAWHQTRSMCFVERILTLEMHPT